MNNMILFFTGLMDGLIFSKIARSMGLYFRIGLRIKKTRMPITAANNDNESNVSAIIKMLISQKCMEFSGICKFMQRTCKGSGYGLEVHGKIYFYRLWRWQLCVTMLIQPGTESIFQKTELFFCLSNIVFCIGCPAPPFFNGDHTGIPARMCSCCFGIGNILHYFLRL